MVTLVPVQYPIFKAGDKNQLRSIPFWLREFLYEKISRKLTKDDKQGAAINRKEKALTRALVREWSNSADKGIKSALSVIHSGNQEAQVSKKQADKMVTRINNSFKNYEKRISIRFAKDMKDIYKLNKNRFYLMFDLTGDSDSKKQLYFQNNLVKSIKKPIDILKAADFGELDISIWEKITSLGLLSAAERYPRDMMRNVQQLIIEEVFKSGLNKIQADKFLTRELTRLLGPRSLNADPDDIKIGLERTNQYFKGLTATNTSFLRNFSQITLMEEAGIARYMIVAIIDNLTSQICMELNGRVFELEYGIKHRDRVLAVDSLDELKEIAPWRKNLEEFGLSEGQKLNEPSAAEVLGKSGMSLPPYHFRCRSEVYPF